MLCFSPCLSHGEDIPLRYIERRGVAVRVSVVFKEDRILTAYLEPQCIKKCEIIMILCMSTVHLYMYMYSNTPL